MNRQHWFVLIVASLAWMFDCFDQQLFTLARIPAMKELLSLPSDHADVKWWGPVVTAIFVWGWATGGLIFGVLGDRIGRVKTMALAVLAYSLFTGLSALSVSVYDFAFYRFLTGLGVGGEFAVGVALVAEAMPESARARALALLQALSAFGNASAALLNMWLGSFEAEGYSAWRWMFMIGAAPALLAMVVITRLQEPERWVKARERGEAKERLGSYRALFEHPKWRKHAILGLLLGLSGVMGVWGIGFFSADLSRAVFRKHYAPIVYEEQLQAAANSPQVLADVQMLLELERSQKTPSPGATLNDAQTDLRSSIESQISGRLTTMAGWVFLMQTFGGFTGIYVFGYFANLIGRRPTFAIALVAAMASTAGAFWFMDQPSDVLWMAPAMGFFQSSLFGGYAIYFPELFPTYLRSTGTSFCYNVGRFISALGPFGFGLLTSRVFAGPAFPEPLPWRYAGVCMTLVFLIGLAVLPFLPETKGKPLPE